MGRNERCQLLGKDVLGGVRYAPAIDAYVPPAPFNPGGNELIEGADGLEDLTVPSIICGTRQDHLYCFQHRILNSISWDHVSTGAAESIIDEFTNLGG